MTLILKFGEEACRATAIYKTLENWGTWANSLSLTTRFRMNDTPDYGFHILKVMSSNGTRALSVRPKTMSSVYSLQPIPIIEIPEDNVRMSTTVVESGPGRGTYIVLEKT